MIFLERVGYFECGDEGSVFAFGWSALGGAEVVVRVDGGKAEVRCGDEGVKREIGRFFEGAESDERALYEMFVHLLKDDMDELEDLEGRITDAEDAALQSSRRV